MSTCPTCNGNKIIRSYTTDITNGLASMVDTLCSTCNGTGSVPTDTNEEDLYNQPNCWCKHSRHDRAGRCHYPNCHIETPTPDQPQADEDSARRRQEFADAGIYPDTDELDEILESLGENYFPSHEYPPSYEPDNIKARKEAAQAIKDIITREREQAKREVLALLEGYTDPYDGEPLSHVIAARISKPAPNEPKEAE